MTDVVQADGIKQCSFEGCEAIATEVACGRHDGPRSHPEPAIYCESHADMVAWEGSPEYTTNCPNCSCFFGVN